MPPLDLPAGVRREAASDIVIVGAGSAGCLLAERLSRDGTRSVTLLEAGGRAGPVSRVPAAFSALFGTRVDWAFETEPQPGLGGRRDRWPRGRALGGSSAINAMIWVRGHPADYDAWQALGAAGWGAAALWSRFAELEDHPEGDGPFGRGGPVRVERLRDPNPLGPAFVAAAEALGLPRDTAPGSSGDGPAAGQGAGPLPVTQRRGERWSAYDAFLRPALGRANLRVARGERALRVVFEGGSGGERAAGVLTADRRGRARFRPAGEVILAAGAVGSPQLLLLSGVGSAAELERAGVRPRLDLPGVGRNLWDHVVVPLLFTAKGAPTLDGADTPWNFARWALARRGPLTSNVAEAAAFARSDRGAGPPDLQIHFGPALFARHGAERSREPHLTLGPTLLTPESRGRLALRGVDPDLPPRIEPGTFDDASDLERIVDGLELCRELAAQPPLARHVAAEAVPGAGTRGRDALAAHAAAWGQTLYHPAGTCRMGALDDGDAVLDPELRVRGATGLRVIDASAMPAPVRGNTNAPTMALALHAAERMLGGSPPER